MLIFLLYILVSTCTSTTLTINLQDENDNSPVFVMPSYEFGKTYTFNVEENFVLMSVNRLT